MFFRFAAAIAVLLMIALIAIALEKQNLALKRAISAQHDRMERLQEQRARLRLAMHELGGPVRLAEAAQVSGARQTTPGRTSGSSMSKLPDSGKPRQSAGEAKPVP